jgi:hypothetical protein
MGTRAGTVSKTGLTVTPMVPVLAQADPSLQDFESDLSPTPPLIRGGQIGDVVQAIDNVPVQGLTLDAIKSLTVGPEGSAVHLDVVRDGRPFSVSLQRLYPAGSAAATGNAVVLVR